MGDESQPDRMTRRDVGSRPPPGTRSPNADPMRDETTLRPTPRAERKRLLPGYQDKFHIPANLIPPDVSLNWKRYGTINQPDDQYLASQRMNGWEPAQAEEFPVIAARYGITKGAILVEGMLLMERPMQLTEDAIRDDKEAAGARVAGVRESLVSGPTATGMFERGKGDVTRTYEAPMPIPDN